MECGEIVERGTDKSFSQTMALSFDIHTCTPLLRPVIGKVSLCDLTEYRRQLDHVIDRAQQLTSEVGRPGYSVNT